MLPASTILSRLINLTSDRTKNQERKRKRDILDIDLRRYSPAFVVDLLSTVIMARGVFCKICHGDTTLALNPKVKASFDV
ncbi:hypothetical protein OPV22_005747 [Ensete ventricosum]|uniref:Uncharacterized protein n=1 Tax=Ensete ventricosum TaxID=4639 RepID=A0AAV8RJD3_ENSVE|nr:hypothetical protein OPV22_005747 [Ensete ventricosum]